jgi:long-chain fatty acid transport protein
MAVLRHETILQRQERVEVQQQHQHSVRKRRVTMHRTQVCIAVCILCVIGAANAYAQIDNLTNMSAEWVRMSNRNAATDAADIVVYNPAGVTALSEGIHVNIANQVMFRMPEHNFADPLGTGHLSFKQDSPDWFMPNLYASYNKGKWAVLGGIYIPAGGANIDYPDGSFTTRLIGAGLIGPTGPYFGAYSAIRGESLEANSTYIGVTLGAAYKINDTFSVAAGLRYVNAMTDVKGELTLAGGTMGPLTPDIPLKVDVDQSAEGWGAMFGIQISPLDRLILTLHAESRVLLDFETEVNDADNLSKDMGLFTDGEKSRRDLPAMIGLGASYQFTPAIRGEVDFNWFSQKKADWSRAADGSENSDLAGDVWSVGAALAYQLSPPLEVSGGFLYTKHEWEDIDAYYINNVGTMEILYSSNLNLSAGVGYRIRPNIKMNFGLSYTLWDNEKIKTPIGSVDTKNGTCTMAFGVDMAF